MKKNISYLLIVILALIAILTTYLIVRDNHDDNNEYSQDIEEVAVSHQMITPMTALEKIESSDVVLIDVRSEFEHNESHIEGSLLIPINEIDTRVFDYIDDLDTTIILYCRSGNRSRDASEILIGLGFTNVYDLGGIISWPYETKSNN